MSEMSVKTPSVAELERLVRTDEQLRDWTPGMELREHIDERRARLARMQSSSFRKISWPLALGLAALCWIGLVAILSFACVLGKAWLSQSH